MCRGRISKSLQTFTAHTLLFCFTILLFLKLDHHLFSSWWIIFFPLFIFHIVVAPGRFSLPAPAASLEHHWVPCHAIVGMPLLVAFELLLCVFLESVYVMRIPAVDLEIVFLPLLVFEFTIFADNLRMLLPGDEENLRDDEIWEILPHFRVCSLMMLSFFATLITLLKLGDGTDDYDWLCVFIFLGIAECFAFLFCPKWSNQAIHRNSQTHEGSSSTGIRYLEWNSGPVVASDDISVDRMCGLQDIGGYIMKALVVAFQILLFIRLKEKPAAASNIPLAIVFSPLFLLQGAVVLFSGSELVEKILLLNNGTRTRRYFVFSAGARDFFGYLYRGSRLFGWSSIYEESREEQARLYHDGALGYNTFCGYSPEVVKKMPKKDLAQEVGRLQAALGEKMKTTKFSLQEVERLQNEKILCQVCFERQLSIVLLPCRHWILCSMCSVKCKKCPICRAVIEERLPIYDV